jgi:two-component system aerobic respiration control protein ArcA
MCIARRSQRRAQGAWLRLTQKDGSKLKSLTKECMKDKRINTKDLIEKIEKMTKARIASQEVVPLDQFREAKKKLDPKIILVIEDDETMRLAMKRILESEGYVTKLAADGTELSTVLDDHPVDLILMDVGLPWVNGFELAQLLKDHRDLKKIPLVFVSGKASEEDMKKAFDLGADDYIKKPFDVEKLKKTVETLLKLNP